MIATPLDERVGHVGGIESVVVDGRRFYFGMDYRSDLVLSPLIDEPADMAEFAARYMAQSDGTHDAAYWSDLVTDAATESSLYPPGGNEFDLMQGLTDSMLYVFGCASGWGDEIFDEEMNAALSALDLDPDDEWDAIGEALDNSDIQRRLREYFASRLPGNWVTVFAPLFQGGNEIPPKE